MAKFSILKLSFVLLFTLLGLAAEAQCPVAALCTPGAASSPFAPNVGAGIYSVRFGTAAAYTSAGYSEGFADNSCTKGASIVLGDRDSLIIQNGTSPTSVLENVRVYIDWNNNGSFDAVTELVLSSDNKKVHRGIISAPGSAQVGQRLRVRIASDYNLASRLPQPCTTPEFSQTEDYYVLVSANVAPPVANFFSADTISCNGSAQFRDQSSGAPTAWAWTFGDGGTANTQNPIHIYASTGRYTVRLIATNANGSDTITRPNYIFFNDTVPVAASCTPTNTGCCNYGTTLVLLQDENGRSLINNATGSGSAGYESFTCTIRGRVLEGRPYTISIGTDTSLSQRISIWVDYNADGVFQGTELVFSRAGTGIAAGTIFFRGGATAQKNEPLRMRIVSDGGSTTLTPCTNPSLGQVEDYTIVLLENTLPPVADFIKQVGSGCDSTVTFVAQPENVVSSYIWDFGDSQTDTTLANTVTHTYSNFGFYSVTLVAIGPYGRDTITKNNIVSYLASPGAASCTAPTQNSCCGVGISNVTFGDINKNSSDAESEGYKDFVCEGSTTLKKGKVYPITIATGSNNTEIVGVWVDWNNDLLFADAEKVFASTAAGTHTGIISMPNNVVLSTALRMRVVSIAQRGGPGGGGEPVACGTINFGQAEDYTVIAVPNIDPPVARFSGPNSTCNGSVTFADSSENTVTSWLWNFGDGDTSTLQNPTHAYADTGTYTVTLIVASAFGADTIVKTDFVTVYTNLNIIDPTCTPATTNNCCGFGIRRVRLNTIDNATGDGSEGYKNYACSETTRLSKGARYELNVKTGTQIRENLRAWIDWNSNGLFEGTEIIGTSLNADSHKISFQVPAGGIEGRGIRMRIMSDFTGNQILDACIAPQSGQIEDYGIVLDSNSSGPAAGFGAIGTTSCNGFIQFIDSSSSVPTSYAWEFGDGTTSSEQNPIKKYTATGQFTVKLKVTNSFGVDSLIRTGYVTITSIEGVRPPACIPVRTSNTGGNFGIRQVQFATVNNTSGNATAKAYDDFTCLSTPEILVGSLYPVSIQLWRGFGERVSGWIDWNNDSTFTANEQVFTTPAQNNSNIVRDTILVPAGAVQGRALRFRLVSTFTNPASDPVSCGTYTNGQTEDYSLTVSARPPQANFGIRGVASTCNGTVRFIDSTLNGATEWLWSFGDGNVAVTQNPIHQYANTGVYTVKLVVKNALGTDSLTRLNYVTVSGLNGPRAPVCYPASIITAGVNTGMTSVTLTGTVTGSTLNRVSGLSTEGYRDFACSDSIWVNVAERITIAVRATAANRTQFVTVLLDANNDGVFANSEQLTGGQLLANQTYNGFINVPNLQIGNRYRLRIIARANGTPPPTCDITNGQAEDYMLVIVPTSTAKTISKLLSVYPNPASKSVKVVLPTGITGQIVPEVVDALGRVVLRAAATAATAGSVIDIPVESLPVGFYTLRLTSSNAIYTTSISISR